MRNFALKPYGLDVHKDDKVIDPNKLQLPEKAPRE